MSSAGPTSKTTYVAFLRGINVGGNKPIRMADLQKAFESLRFTNVKTVLASGNVLFDAPPSRPAALTAAIEKKLKQAFGTEIPVLVRTLKELQRLAESEPFRGVAVTPQTRLYVTFLTEKPASKLKIPYASPDRGFRILRVTACEVCSVVILTPQHGTLDLMGFLEKEFGKRITTRNWNTVLRLLKAKES